MTELFKSTYHKKKVFVTGHTGFKGSWLSIWLADLGAQVKGYALAPEKNSLYERIRKKLEIRSVIADIRNSEKLNKEIKNFQPDFVFHLAAQPLVRYSYKHPLETFDVNGMGTANLLQGVSKLKKKCVVVAVTTDKVYENKEQNYAYAEHDKLGGYDPYSASKACAELIIQSYRLSFFNPASFDQHRKSVASVRAGNVIGGGDYAKDRIVPDIIRALKKHQPVEVRSPQSIRPWQHVLDPLAGYLLLGAKLNMDPVKYASAFNFGPDANDTMTVEELVKKSIAVNQHGKYFVNAPKEKLHEAGLLMLDNSKAKNELGWSPVFNSAGAVEQTMSWYKRSLEKNADHHALCLEDISNYESKMNL
ncbi:MAG TPA: CDP-glucose 4,6-dehydratase [Bacteroidia bacterium]